jgi:nicotinamide-nucleotide amidase
VAVGDELLLGDVADTNTAAIAARLTDTGPPLTRATIVGDRVEEIRAAVAEAVRRRPRAVIVTGGLGPTSDDRTREALAGLAGVPLRRDAGLERGLTEWYAGRARALPASARQQADVPDGARVLPNRTGSAPGLVLDVDGVPVYCLPGVPSELRAMAEETVLPELADPARLLTVRSLRVPLLGESAVADLLAGWDAELPSDVSLGYLAEPGSVRVRLSAAGPGAAARLAPYVDSARRLLGDAVGSLDDETLEAAVLRRLRAAGATVAVAESLTGGGIGVALTGVPGASDVFRGGIVAYATALKAQLCGVDPDLLAAAGPVDPRVAAAMADGVRERLAATYGVAATGVAGPDPQDGRTPGTVHVAVAASDGVRIASPHLPGDRDQVRRLSVVAALDLLRRVLDGTAAPSPSG